MTDVEITKLDSYSDEQLHELLRHDIQFTEAVILSMPELASDNAFDLYGKEWIKRFWTRLVIEVRQIPSTSDATLKWAVDATAAALSVMIAEHFDLPDSAIPASVALAILILRAAKAKSDLTQEPPSQESSIVKSANNKQG